MPTENELRDALTALADQAPDNCDASLAERSRRRNSQLRQRSRILLPIMAAATVLAVAAASLLAVNRPTGTTGQPSLPAASTAPLLVTGTLPANRYVFNLAPIPGYTTRNLTTSATQQSAAVETSAGHAVATVALYAPGSWQPARPTDARDVTVNGRSGFYGTLHVSPAELAGLVFQRMSLTQPDRSELALPGALAWQYQPGAWALVYAYAEQKMPATAALTKQQAITIARALRPGQSRAARVPAQFSALPAGLQLQGITWRSTTGQEPSALFSFGPSDTTKTTLMVGVNPGTGAHLPHSVTIATPHGSTFHGGYTAAQGDLEVTDGNAYLSLTSLTDDGTGPREPQPSDHEYTLAQLTALVKGMHLARDVADVSTWFDAATATQ